MILEEVAVTRPGSGDFVVRSHQEGSQGVLEIITGTTVKLAFRVSFYKL
jgi:hypothetical protein